MEKPYSWCFYWYHCSLWSLDGVVWTRGLVTKHLGNKMCNAMCGNDKLVAAIKTDALCSWRQQWRRISIPAKRNNASVTCAVLFNDAHDNSIKSVACTYSTIICLALSRLINAHFIWAKSDENEGWKRHFGGEEIILNWWTCTRTWILYHLSG